MSGYDRPDRLLFLAARTRAGAPRDIALCASICVRAAAELHEKNRPALCPMPAEWAALALRRARVAAQWALEALSAGDHDAVTRAALAAVTAATWGLAGRPTDLLSEPTETEQRMCDIIRGCLKPQEMISMEETACA